MNDFNVEDVVLVYKETPTFEEGAICQVIDRDPNDNSYAVADLRDIGKADRDISIILNRYAKWVNPENMVKLEFDKPEDEGHFFIDYILPALIGAIMGTTVPIIYSIL